MPQTGEDEMTGKDAKAKGAAESGPRFTQKYPPTYTLAKLSHLRAITLLAAVAEPARSQPIELLPGTLQR